MFKFELNFLVNDNWENVGYSIRERLPETGDTFYHERNTYKVVKLKEDDDEFNVYHLYLSK